MVNFSSLAVLKISSLLALMGNSPLLEFAEAQSTNTLGCIGSFNGDYSQDLFPHKVEPLNSKQWDIAYYNTYKVITNKDVNKSYLFYQCGTEPPAGAEDQYHLVLPVPLQDGIALKQTTSIPHVEFLGERTSITGFLGFAAYISSSCLTTMIDDGTVPIVDSSDDVALANFIANNPDVVIIGGSYHDADGASQLIVSEDKETDNKATFEWHKVYAALFNLEHLGNSLTDEVSDRYDCVANNAALSVESSGTKPSLLWAYYADYDNYDGTRTVGWIYGTCPNYYCEFADDCSADFIELSGGSLDCWGSPCMTDDEFLAAAKDADHWVYPAFDFNDLYAEKKEMLQQFKSVENKEVYDIYGSGPNAWFEQRMVEYDVVLEDICEVVGTLNNHDRVWLRSVFEEYSGDLDTCTNVAAALVSQADQCTKQADDDCRRLVSLSDVFTRLFN